MTQKPDLTDAALDALLTEWATRPVAGDPHVVAAAVLRPRARWWPRVAAGGGLAAAVAATLVLAGPFGAVEPVPEAAVVMTSTEDDAAAFELLFTPTPDEEELIDA